MPAVEAWAALSAARTQGIGTEEEDAEEDEEVSEEVSEEVCSSSDAAAPSMSFRANRAASTPSAAHPPTPSATPAAPSPSALSKLDEIEEEKEETEELLPRTKKASSPPVAALAG